MDIFIPCVECDMQIKVGTVPGADLLVQLNDCDCTRAAAIERRAKEKVDD